MKLVEISKLIVVPGKAKSSFLGGKAPDEHLPFTRAAWQGKANVQFMGGNLGMYIFGNDVGCQYAFCFDDLMADDWELVAGEAA